MKQFSLWLSTTSPSLFLQNHNAWTIPGLQSLHIIGIAMVMGAVLMLDLRILELAGMDQTMEETIDRFGPWLTASLWWMLATGLLMVVGQPTRELMSFSFRVKVVLVAAGALASVFLRRRPTKAFAILTFLLWMCIIVLGRLIAYDHVWGSWSPAAG